MDDGVAGIGLLEHGLAGEQGDRHLVQMAIQGGDVQHGFAADVFLSDAGRSDQPNRKLVEMPALRRLVKQRVSKVVLQSCHLEGQQTRGKLVEMAVCGGEVKDGVARIAAL